jgi:hypothetical protein
MKPILFSTSMVKAIVEDRKTKTRRVIKPQPPEFAEIKMFGEKSTPFYCFNGSQTEIKARYQPGDILWVRETWANLHGMGFGNDPRTDKPWEYAYLADSPKGTDSYQLAKDYGVKWKPSIHMPRKAARIFLRVTDVRAERIQDITENEAQAEGVKAYGQNNCSGTSARIAFAELWDGLNEKRGYGWRKNPWVWVYTFERCEKPGGTE